MRLEITIFSYFIVLTYVKCIQAPPPPPRWLRLAVVMLLFGCCLCTFHCFFLFLFFVGGGGWGGLSLSLFWYVLLCMLSRFAIIWQRKRELVALFCCLTDVLLLYMFLALWVCLRGSGTES